MIWDDIYPLAVRTGMKKKEFLHSTMKDINIALESFGKNQEENVKRIEYESWLTGMYIISSISCAFSKKAKYPKNPIAVDTKDIKQVAKVTGKSEEELRQEEIYMSLLIKQANANIQTAREEREKLQSEQGS